MLRKASLSLLWMASHQESRGSHFSCCQVEARSVPLDAARKNRMLEPGLCPQVHVRTLLSRRALVVVMVVVLVVVV